MGENRSLDDFLHGEGDDGVADEDPASKRSTATTAAAADAGAGAEPTDTGETDESAAERTEESTGDTGREAVEADSEADSAHDGDDAPSVDPPRATYRWSADGDGCPACGATVDRQWRDGDRFVCADCKDW
ncbi:zinc ribbon domain-containing protein [Salinigranum marinum]|uniref:zinc ribbon domain-containing protein n=1 Tax=Salinigranum marinum TaxID=1515595 RepID=UPI002989BF78|nr:zinc ribbon domain-containing protein [Salinigranum marinum]